MKLIIKRARHWLAFAAASLGRSLALRLPRRVGLALFGAVGWVAFLFPNRERARTLRHLELIYGNTWSRSQIFRVARQVFVDLGRNIFDAQYLSGGSGERLDRIVRHDSFDQVREAYEQGRGIIIITAHTGCFEMLLHYFAHVGFKCFAIGRRMFDERLERLVRQTRSGDNIEYMDRDESPRRILKLLREGRVMGVLIDQDTRVEGVFADFLGKPAFTPSGPVKMAMRFDIPTFVVTTARLPDQTHYIFISPQLKTVSTGDFGHDLERTVAQANDLICATIRRYPSQWVWMHRRWRRRPRSGQPADRAAANAREVCH